MTFEMTITKRKPTAEGQEEHIVRIKNSQSFETGNDLLAVLRLALESPAPFSANEINTAELKEWPEPKVALPKTKTTPPPPPPPPPKKEKQVQPTPSRPKQVDLIGSNSSGFSIGELIKRAEAEEDSFEKKETIQEAEKIQYAREPIEVIDRDPKRRVKLWVNCPNCEYEGDKGVDLGRTHYFCPNNECRAKLHIMDATDEHGAKDDKGYVRLAQERFLTREELYYKHQNAQEN